MGIEHEVPDFKGWCELSRRKEIFLPTGESFIRLIYYIKFKPVEKVFIGMRAFLYGKETYRVWKKPDPSGERKQNFIALLLEDGNWAVSLPFYTKQEVPTLFNVFDDLQNRSVRVSILTSTGWKSRIVKVE